MTDDTDGTTNPVDDKIAACMAYVRKRVAEAPSHEELFTGIEALLRFSADPSVADPPSQDAEQPPAEQT